MQNLLQTEKCDVFYFLILFTILQIQASFYCPFLFVGCV